MRFLSSRASLIIAIVRVLLVCSPAATFAAPDDPFADFDAHASQALGDWKVPAVAISVVKDGRVVFARLRRAQARRKRSRRCRHGLSDRLDHKGIQRHGARHAGGRRAGAMDRPRSSITFRNSSFTTPG